MKSNSEIISEIIETARKIERIQIRKDYLQDTPGADDPKCIKMREEEILNLDLEICSLGAKLNAFKWLFEDSEG